MKVSEYRKRTPYYEYKNPNPMEDIYKAWDRGDCVIRAFALAADITWVEAFDILIENARKRFDVPNYRDNYKEVFNERYKYFGVSVKAGKKRMTVEDFCKKHKKGNFIVRVASHVTAIINGICYDTWNPKDKCIYCYWEVN